MKWTKTNRQTLLGCETDKELHKNFPKFSIEILRRYQRKFSPRKTKRVDVSILLPDIHHPYHDVASLNAVFKCIKDLSPKKVVLIGDALEMAAIDHWKQEHDNARYFEGKRLLLEYKEFIAEILEPIEKMCPRVEKIYMAGNHEDWAYQLVDKFPQLEGMIEPEIAMELEKRGWQWVPWILKDRDGNYRKGMIKIGKLTIAHGFSTRKYHAAATTEVYDKSVVYGHSHDVQLYTKVHEEDPEDYHSAQSIGCLCNKSPNYGKGRPNRWVHAFGVLYTRNDGSYNLYVPIIINGRFTFNGKTYDGNG